MHDFLAADAPYGAPPLWISTTIALMSATIVGIITAYVSRLREHQKWLWERRVDLYIGLAQVLRATEWSARDSPPIESAEKILHESGEIVKLGLIASDSVKVVATSFFRYHRKAIVALDSAQGLAGVEDALAEARETAGHYYSQMRSSWEELLGTISWEVETPPRIFDIRGTYYRLITAGYLRSGKRHRRKAEEHHHGNSSK